MSKLVRQLIRTANATQPVAEYNQAVVAKGMVYVSGCMGTDKNTLKLVPGGISAQAAMALKNLVAVLEAAGSGPDKVVKNTIFVKDFKDYDAVNEEYKKVFVGDYPARCFFQVDRLTLDALVAIESTAIVNN